jgi:hypothetical protein
MARIAIHLAFVAAIRGTRVDHCCQFLVVPVVHYSPYSPTTSTLVPSSDGS